MHSLSCKSISSRAASRPQAPSPCHKGSRTGIVTAAQSNDGHHELRRSILLGLVAGSVQLVNAPGKAQAIEYGLDYKKELARRRRKIPESEFSDGPEGLKFYDIVAGSGAEAKVGARVAVHYDVKFRNVTFVTSRQGMGVTGGTPVGFDVGQPAGAAGSTLPGIDIGVRGMRVGGVRRLIVPPNLAYGSRGVGEIPPNATLTVDLELLSIKTSPLGYRTKLVEG
eukprot:CAMPEP_0202902694 /NCGR_PEP_ID=MMETSP1392-20130828/17006_1 /ASSEMBLY_ACC=CAM_ASM_000868 /TAXON_ID=225041 /ORGANISM="Chlamydomonas chlamydogama, Strain SAG 11-48b" /LENGTH=223 /DNA_ID=CAMNT_0049589501 /DNA_START=1 /DNA_END=672 /DNA_ORIENTATION=-